jgi:hypothetical protein
MKFANYIFKGKNLNNLGDHIQIITIDFLYQQMGVPLETVIYINKDDLHCYDGEPVLLPVSMPLVEYKERGMAGMFSPKITPVFLGLTMSKDELLSEEISYFKNHEPVGARDERTYNTLTKYGINSYLNGCLTPALPVREKDAEKQNKIFIIDPTAGIKDYIPSEIARNAVWDTHMIYKYIENPIQKTQERFNQYRDEAKLVITSLLHCSIPCMAMGIPVILAKDLISYRFSWLEALLKIHTTPDYESINWNPVPIEYESHKKLIIDLFNKRMSRENSTFETEKIHNFYMNRERKNYVVDSFMKIQEFIDNTWLDFEKEYEYSVWGLTQVSEQTVSYILKRYPNAKLKHVYDIRTGLNFHGFSAIHPENLALYENETVFVTAWGAVNHAKQLFQETGKPEHLYKIIEVVF